MSHIKYWFLFISMCFTAYASPLCTTEIPTYLIYARDMQEHILPNNNNYQHHHFEVDWKGVDGATEYVCRTNCSGFVTALLKRTYGYDKDYFKKWLGRAHPRARSYYEAITKENGFQRINHIESVLQGDFIAINYPPGTNDPSHDTGHIMMVNQLPALQDSESPVVEDTQQWKVGIIDCSHTGHGKTDTRYFDHKFHGGVGKGSIRIYTDLEGNIVGYSWSTEPSSKYYNADTRPVAIGRLKI